MLTVKAISANNRNAAPDLGALGRSVSAAPIPKAGYSTNSATNATTARQTTRKAFLLVIALLLFNRYKKRGCSIHRCSVQHLWMLECLFCAPLGATGF